MSTLQSKWSDLFFFDRGRPYIFVLILCLIISSLLGSQTPLYISELSRSYENDIAFEKTIKILGFIFLGVYFNRVIYQLTINKYIKFLMQETRTICFNKWLYSYEIKSGTKAEKDNYTQGEVISRIMNDTESLRELMTSGTFGIFIDVFFVISCLVSFISLNTRSGLFLSFSEIFAALTLVYGSKYMRVVFLKVRESRASMSRLLANMVGGIKETYYTNHHNYASKRGHTVFQDFLDKQLVANVWDAGYYSIAESLYPIFLILIVLIFPYSQITEAAIIFAIVDLIQRSIGPIKDIAAKIANIQRAHSGIFRIQEFLCDMDKRLSSENNSTSKEGIELSEMEIKVNFFEYPKSAEQEQETSFSLKDIHISAKPGELVGIVGLSGCGKSTLLNIMAANIFPTVGEILLRGKNKDLSFSGKVIEKIIDYRREVGIVSQDSHIFSDTVAFNICMSEEVTPELRVFWKDVVSQIPYLSDWGINLTDKLDQKVLSVGQKQLMASLRSCFLCKPVVLFDEISSGLDGDLELALRNMVQLIQEKSLTFIVAHRLETIIEADQIIVMHEGKIEDRGKHKFLLNHSKVYQEFIAQLQSPAIID